MTCGLSYALMSSTLETQNIQFFNSCIFTLNCDNKYKCLNVIMYVCIYVFKDAVKEFPLVG